MSVNSLERRKTQSGGYDHQRRRRIRRVLRFMIDRWGFWLLAKFDRAEGLVNIPAHGPTILMMNHIAFIDSIVVLNVVPRDIVPLAKVEVYDYPLVGVFPRLWGVIPVRREEFDRAAVRQALEVLEAGEIVLVAPEATRGPALRQGKEGVAYLASRSDAPVVPVAIQGTPGFPALRYTAPWRGPGAHLAFGRPFRFRAAFQRADRAQLRMMTDEAMYVLSAMLPPGLRGFYADLSRATQETIEFL
jgi:1-acyl-sn-glycerol-3-phosphate acyltransferase